MDKLIVRQVGAGSRQAALDGLAADRRNIEAGAVIGKTDHDFTALVAGLNADVAGHRLASVFTFGLGLEAMIERIADHVLERTDHAVQHGAIHFHLGADQFQFDAFAQFARRLAHDVPQARALRGKTDHARAHQSFLQLGIDARLLDQYRLCLAGVILEIGTYGEQIVQTLGQTARQCLQAGKTVEFEWIEILTQLRGGFLGARHNLRFGLDFKFANLVAETCGVAIELGQVFAQAEDLLLHARTRDTHLTGVIHEFIQQRSAHADLAAPVGTDTFRRILTIRTPDDVHIRKLVFERGRNIAYRKPECRRFFSCSRYGFIKCWHGGIWRGRRCMPKSRQHLGAGRRKNRNRLVILHLTDHGDEGIVHLVQKVHEFAVGVDAATLGFTEQTFSVMSEVAHGHGAGHARAAFKRMQLAFELRHRGPVGAVAAPLGQRLFDRRHDVRGFLEENLEQLRIEIFHDGFVRARHRNGCRHRCRLRRRGH